MCEALASAGTKSISAFRKGVLPSNVCDKTSTNNKDRFLVREKKYELEALPPLRQVGQVLLTLRMIPNSVMESQMLRKVSMVFAFSPMDVLWTFKDSP